AVGDARILEGPTTRLIIVIVVMVSWGAINLLAQARQRKTDARMVQSLTAGPEAPPPGRQAAGAADDIEVLRRRLADALLLLKRSAASGGRRRYLYQLPWD